MQTTKKKVNHKQTTYHFPQSFLALPLGMVAVMLANHSLQAADITKADTGTDLNAPASWSGGATPTSADVAAWSGTSLGAGLTLGAATNWLGINVAGAASDVELTGAGMLTLGASGVTAAKNLTLGVPVALGASQTWTVNSGLGITVSGALSGASALTFAGPGTLTLSGANTYSGATAVQAGTLTLSGNRTAASGALTVGADANLATVNLQAGAFSFGSSALVVGSGSAGVTNGILNQTGGTISFSGGNAVLVGNGTSAAGIYNLSDGSITMGFSSVKRGVILGVNEYCSGVFNLSGNGNLNLPSGALVIARYDSAANYTSGAFYQTGGSATFGTLALSSRALSSGGNATLSLTGGSFTSSSFAALAAGLGDTATITIGGSADVTLPAFPTTRGGGSTATITFDGGTLRPYAASAAYLGGLNDAYLTARGANFNVASGKDITIAQLLEDAAGQAGVLTKSGSGTLTLTSSNTYSGGTVVSNGTLLASSLGSGPVTVRNGAGLGAGSGVATLTLNNNLCLDSGVLVFDITNLFNADKMVVAGSLTPSGVTTIMLPNAQPLASGDYTLLEVNGTLGGSAANFAVASQSPKTYAIVYQPGSPNRVLLRVSGPIASKSWLGDGLANQWNIGSSANWVETGGVVPTVYLDNDVVLFDDLATNLNVDIATVVSPGAVTVNSTNSYSFSGAGGIAGSIGLTKDGTGALALLGANTYSGGTTLRGTGPLAIGHARALGTGPLTLKSALASAAPTVILSGGIVVTNPVVIDASTGREAILSTNGNNTLSGGIAISGGTANAIYLSSSGDYGSVFTVNGPITASGWTSTFSLRGLDGNSGLLAGPITLSSLFQVIGGANWKIASTSNTWTEARLSQGAGGLLLGADNALATTAKVRWDTDSSGALDLAGYDQTVAGLDCATTSLAPMVGNSSTGRDSLLRINGAGYTFAGVLVDALGAGTRKLSLELLAGEQTLSGYSSYTGTTTIDAGTLWVNGSLGGNGAVTVKSNATLAGGGVISGPVTVNSGGTLRAGNSAGAGFLTLSSLTLGAAGGDTQSLKVTLGSATVTVNGPLTARGTTTIYVSNPGTLVPGTYNLVTYSGPTVTSGFALGPLPARVQATLQYNASSIDLNITSVVSDSARWTGAESALWNTQATNWVLVTAGTPTAYADGLPGDAVTFDDTLSAHPDITLNTTVSPAGITFNNITTAYSITGTGNIAGTGGFTKTGTNLVTLATSNSLTGAVSIGGRVVIKHSAALGLGAKTVTVKSTAGNYSELHLDGSAGPITLPAEYSFSTYGDTVFAGNIVNDAGDNIVNSSLNMTSGGGNPKMAVLGGSLTFNGNITCNNGSSGKTMQLAGIGNNTINGVIQNGSKQSRLSVLGGTWTLTATNPYDGVTTIATNGTLVVNGSIGVGAVTVQAGGRLSGTGTVAGATTVQSGGTLSPGPAVGTLKVSSTLALQGAVEMEIGRNDAQLTNDRVAGISALTYGGTLVVTNVGGSPLRAGDSFQLFAASSYGGAFTNIVYPDDYTFTNSLDVDGRIWVTGAPTPPTPPNFPPGGISRLADHSISLTVTGAVGTVYRLWASTNVALTPVTSTWTLVTNGTVTTTPFTLFDSGATNAPRRFYLFSTP